MRMLHGRLPIPESVTALPGLLRMAANRLEAWIYDHANLARWDGEEVTIEPAPLVFVHHVPTGITRAEVERAYETAARAARLNYRR